ncbi:hypothetical protein K503DRAFT_228048 [Rhizopogon vinicolor AM-OR11-026]|uniref:Uncharacterized protein n=1 Tax=Rhizopogon vinicolor AM-OR11-026 TaxID=1314800 RepID=A0A1B7MY67_9AGAM|nr:hypothetical protein K503DRAFT_228048 [Rhizopogon vinicolor AM-OR11-026]
MRIIYFVSFNFSLILYRHFWTTSNNICCRSSTGSRWMSFGATDDSSSRPLAENRVIIKGLHCLGESAVLVVLVGMGVIATHLFYLLGPIQ